LFEFLHIEISIGEIKRLLH